MEVPSSKFVTTIIIDFHYPKYLLKYINKSPICLIFLGDYKAEQHACCKEQKYGASDFEGLRLYNCIGASELDADAATASTLPLN